MIARLQISDLHLGDPRSTLGNPEIAAAVVADIARLSGGHIGKLVVAGDAHEECVPGDLSVLDNGIARSVAVASEGFFGRLFREVRVEELVVMPGNHDLCTWIWYVSQHPELGRVTSYEGVRAPATDWPWSILYSGFQGSHITFAYPLYWDTSVGRDYPMLLTTHGHLLDPLVLGWDPDWKYAALRALGCVRPDVPKDASEISSVSRLAAITMSFCTQLWARYSARDYAYSNYVMRRLDHPQSCRFQVGLGPGEHQISPGEDDPPAGQGYLGNVPWFLQAIVMDPELPTPVGSLRQGNPSPTALTRPSCLTFGHDHLGIFNKVAACGVPFVAADSGGWTCEFEGHLPHSHALVWSSPGQVVPEPYFFLARTAAGGLF